MSIKDQIKNIKDRIAQAAQRSGRSVSDIELIAVSKTVAAAQINEAIEAGATIIGENKVQEAASKFDALLPVQKHMLGSLQTNKARRAVELFDVIQSVDRPRLAAALDRIAAENAVTQDCLIEVKVSSEESKAGIDLDQAGDFIDTFGSYPHLKLRGLMTIAPFDVSEHETRACFKRLKDLFDQKRAQFVGAPILSMGMTDDFEIAIEEGSNMVRIGRAIFGARPLKGKA